VKRLLALAFLCSTFCGCSRVKLGYPFADWLLKKQAKKYLLLDSRQEEFLDAEVESYHAWHRREMLPLYAGVCRRIAQGFRKAEKPEDNIAAVMKLSEEAWRKTLEPMIPPLAKLMAGMDAKGIFKLEQAYKEDSELQHKLYTQDPEAALKRRAAKTVAYVEDFAGSLSKEQEGKIEAISRSLKAPNRAWLEDRERRKAGMIRILKEGKGAPAVEQALRAWWLRSRVGGEKDPTRIEDGELEKYFLEIEEALSPGQLEKAAQKMEKYASDFEDLAAGASK
jgi:hypothetical protein